MPIITRIGAAIGAGTTTPISRTTIPIMAPRIMVLRTADPTGVTTRPATADITLARITEVMEATIPTRQPVYRLGEEGIR